MVRFQNTLPMMLHLTLDGVMPVYRELFAHYDLTEQQWRILRMLWEVEQVSATELARQTLLPKPSLVGIIDRLGTQGLVERHRSVRDRRSVFIVATSKGRALAKVLLPQAEAIHAHIQNLVSAEDWATMERILETITTGMAAVKFEDIVQLEDS